MPMRLDIAHEEPLFLGAKFIGKYLRLRDGQVVWLRTLKNEHVMRNGTFGFDAATYDAHFRGKLGFVLIRLPEGIEYNASMDVIDAHGVVKDKTAGLQVFMEFRYWTRTGPITGPVATLPHDKVQGTSPWRCRYCGRDLEQVEVLPGDDRFATGTCKVNAACRKVNRQTVTRTPAAGAPEGLTGIPEKPETKEAIRKDDSFDL